MLKKIQNYKIKTISKNRLTFIKTKVGIEQEHQMLVPHIQQLQQALGAKYLSMDPLSQLQMLKSQYEIMQSIKNMLQKRRYVNQQIITINGLGANSSAINILDQSITNDCNNNTQQYQSTINNNNNSSNIHVQNIYTIGDNSYSHNNTGIGFAHNEENSYINTTNNNININSGGRSKFREQMQQSNLSIALKQVQNSCNSDTYQIIKQHVSTSKVKQSQYLQKMTSKLIQEKDELASQLLIIRMEKTAMEKELDKYRKIVSTVQQEKKKIKNKIDYVLKKENQVFKLQTSFAFKQKINLQLKKRYERLVGAYLTNQAKIQKMYEQLDKIWNMINQKMNNTGNSSDIKIQCMGECWKKQAMRKAKQQLIQQRKLIKQQSIHLQKQYQVMTLVSEQFKRIFQQPDKRQSQRKQIDNSSSNINGDFGTQKSIREQNQLQIPNLALKLSSRKSGQ